MLWLGLACLWIIMFQVFYFTAFWTLSCVLCVEMFFLLRICRAMHSSQNTPSSILFRWPHRTLDWKWCQKSLLMKTQQLFKWNTYFNKWQNLKHLRDKVIKKWEMQEMNCRVYILWFDRHQSVAWGKKRT